MSASNATSSGGFLAWFQSGAVQFSNTANTVFATLDKLTINVGKGAVIFLIILGVLLIFGRLDRHRGKSYLEGGVIIAIFIAFVVPWLMGLQY